MKKRILFSILGLIIVIAVLAGIKTCQIRAMIAKGKNFVPPPETVTTAVVKAESWETSLTAVGTLTAVQGVTVAAELAGKVVEIAFAAGTNVKKGDLLIRQDTTSEKAQLPGAIAQVTLTRAVLERDEKMITDHIISQSDYDTAVANHQQAIAQAENIRATIGKKTIRAPFSGTVGIRQVNLGQILREGDPIVTLQSLDPIYVDFTLPQQQLPMLRSDLPVRVTCDALPGVTIDGHISTVNPLVDAETRSVQIRATAANPDGKLLPGMYINAAVGLPIRKEVLIIPATAVLYAPFGDSVFIVEETKDQKGGKVVRQQFVRLGDKRGDFISVTRGVKEGDIVVSTGVFKLRNGQAVVIDNRLTPEFKTNPSPENN